MSFVDRFRSPVGGSTPAVEQARLPVVLLRVAPGIDAAVRESSPDALAIGTAGWVSVADGRPVETPTGARTHEAGEWLPGHGRFRLGEGLVLNDGPEPVDVSDVAGLLPGDLLRAQHCDADRIVETDVGAGPARTLWWVTGGAVRRVGRIPRHARVESLGHGAVAVVVAEERSIELHDAAGERVVVSLPTWLEPYSSGGGARLVWSVPAAGVLVLSLANGLLAWMPVDALLAARGADSMLWEPREAPTLGVTDDLVEGEVLMATPSMTVVSSGTNRIVVRAETGCAKHERVRLEGNLGGGRWMRLVRRDGRVVSLAGGIVAETHPVRRPGPRTWTRTAAQAQVAERLAALARLGIGTEFAELERDEQVDALEAAGFSVPEETFAILHRHYEARPDRAVAEGYLAHDWRFGQETADVVAELMERVGSPLLKQTSNEDGTIVVEGNIGLRTLVEVTLPDVVEACNDALAHMGDARRFHSLDTGGDWLAYLLLTPDVAADITTRDLLPLEGAHT